MHAKHPSWLAGFDVGGTKCTVCIAPDAAHITDRIVFPTVHEQGFPGTFQRLSESFGQLLKKHKLKPAQFRAVGVSCGGPLNSATGIILSPPNLPGWDRVPITDIIEKEFSVPCFLLNDADAGALAEWRLGAGRGLSDLIFCTMGSGFGAGLILDGRLYHGSTGLAGEVGHIRLKENGPLGFGKAGSLEGFCGGSGIARLTEQRIRDWPGSTVLVRKEYRHPITARSLARAALQGDKLALEVIQEVATRLGEGLAVLIDILNPQMIVIGSIFTRIEALLRPAMEKAVAREALPLSRSACRIVPAQLGEDLGCHAALMVAARAVDRLI